MIKTSVKKPYFVLVGVIMVIVLGIVAFTKMKTDLIPSVKVPYLALVTTYPGASPQRVETDITEPVENTIGTLSGIETLTSTSAENYSLIMIEFTEDSDMEACASKVARSVENITLPDLAGKPIVVEISSDMLATMYVGVTKQDADIYELTDYVKEEVVPEFKRQDGVASVSEVGGVIQSVEIRLMQDKIDEVNERILKKVNKSLSKADKEIQKSKEQLDDGKDKINSGKNELENAQSKQAGELAKFSKQLDQALAMKAAYESQVSSLTASIAGLEAERDGYQAAFDKVNENVEKVYQENGAEDYLPKDIRDALEHPEKLEALRQALILAGEDSEAQDVSQEEFQALLYGAYTRVNEINAEINNLNTELLVAKKVLEEVEKSVAEAEKNYEKVESGKITAAAAFGSSAAELNAAKEKLVESEAKIKEAEKTLKESAKVARENANIDQLLKMDTLSKLIAAQNFDMPVGYISEDKTQYLLKVGDEISNFEELNHLVLCKVAGVGDVRLSDVAEVTYIDDSDENYARMNGKPAIVLSVMKSSTAFTSEVSEKCEEAMEKMSESDKGLDFTVVMDQGDYIDVIVNSVLSNLIFGAVLAILVLMLFLWDPRPTLVIGISIPLSVLFAIVLMYFSGITLNAISLSGLALGIGMLVDNSVVSIENIYRLRNEGISAGRAAVEGAKQIAGAITASTITTICVFLPMLFTEGLTRELLMDMCLTITYSLVASLVVALTVVPAMSATLLKSSKEHEGRLFDGFLDLYEGLLRFCLRFKVVPILLSIVLLAFSVYTVGRMGIVIFPEMASNQVSADFTFPAETENKRCAKLTDDIIAEFVNIKGVEDVGV
ncbi:MAG: efflux RND transporter permease subunit, partial [Lachnospiraceae bacterium]|nr:efflux RND transporter permease subunit [Lachnospiraceae bacterium]